MRKRGVVLLLILSSIIALAAVAQSFRFDQSVAAEDARVLAREREIASLVIALADLRAAQAGYVAAGQGAAFWFSRASELISQIESSIPRLRQSSPSTDAQALYDSAAAALTELVAIDRRARDRATNDRFLASDLVFEEALEASNRVSGELAAARIAESQAGRASISRLTRLRFGMNGAALAVILLASMMLARAAARTAPVPAETVQTVSPVPARIVAPATVVATSPTRQALPLKPAPGPPAMPISPPPPPPANVADAAELCVDLARVMDGRDVPGLVERTGRVLQAKGTVLWVTDSSGAMLRVSTSHGYPEKILARLGPLQIDADNVTSRAFRTMQPQSMEGTAEGAPGAIAVPLITASGCVGVLAAELRPDANAVNLMPIARIIAAQFAALMVPADGAAVQRTG